MPGHRYPEHYDKFVMMMMFISQLDSLIDLFKEYVFHKGNGFNSDDIVIKQFISDIELRCRDMHDVISGELQI